MTDRELIRTFPAVAWGRALPIHVPGVGHGLACRLCVAHHGLRADEIPQLPKDGDAFAQHMRNEHPEVLA